MWKIHKNFVWHAPEPLERRGFPFSPSFQKVSLQLSFAFDWNHAAMNQTKSTLIQNAVCFVRHLTNKAKGSSSSASVTVFQPVIEHNCNQQNLH